MALRIPRLRVNKTWVMLGLAILLGLAATGLTTLYLQSREKSIQAELEAKTQRGPDQEVVVANRDLPAGVLLDGSMVSSRPIPGELISRDYISPDAWDRFDGARTLAPLQAGIPLRMQDLEEKGHNISDLLEDGMRAITIDTDDSNSISQMVRPGNIVDLFLILPDTSSSDAASSNGQQIVLFIQRLKVFATGQKVNPQEATVDANGGEAARYATFTFEVTPEQAARIALGQKLGTFRVALRKQPDDTDVALGRINTHNLLRKAAIADTPEDFDQSSIQFIIGGGNSNGVGSTVNVNVPGLAGAPAAATGGVNMQQVAPAGTPAAAMPYMPSVPTGASR